MQIIQAVAHDRKQLQFYRDPSVPHDSALEGFYALVESCTTYNPAERPTAAEAERKLRDLHLRCIDAVDGATCPVIPLGVVPPRGDGAPACQPDDGSSAP